MKQHHVIFVPGIGDDRYYLQSRLVKFWRLLGARPHFHAMPWLGDEAFEPKLQRLLDEIDLLVGQGHKVSLVGASAGASAIINAYAKRPDKLAGVVYICGKINHPETVSEATMRTSPAFRRSLELLQHNLIQLTPSSKHRMKSYYSLRDKAVPYEDTRIPGVSEARLSSLGHALAILYGLTLGAPGIMRYLKQLR